jgi:prepilin-type N-terminal cleavage/methylation domain-containing protein
MMRTTGIFLCRHSTTSQSGFSLLEFMISSMMLLIISAAVFGMLSDVQRTASYQAEIQTIVNNAQAALQTIERYIRQAGNNPLGAGLLGINIAGPFEVRIQSDVTGSLGPGNPDKGDPDGDINDSGENVAIRYNQAARTIEIVPDGGSAQIAAGNITGLTFVYYDADGNMTSAGKNVSRIRVIIRAASPLPNPQTHRIFAMEIGSDIQLATWQPDIHQIV